MRYLKTPYTSLKHIIVIPIVSSLIIPILLADISAEIYHRLCFPLYGMPYVKRRRYIRIDRHKLQYLNLFQKLYCVYCGYGNGVIQYWAKIAADTELYWCGIQHKKNKNFKAPEHHKYFPEYGDEAGFKNKYKNIK